MTDHVCVYVHPAAVVSRRVGRTARAGAKGRALTFIEDGDRVLLKEVGGTTWARCSWVLVGG